MEYRVVRTCPSANSPKGAGFWTRPQLLAVFPRRNKSGRWPSNGSAPASARCPMKSWANSTKRSDFTSRYRHRPPTSRRTTPSLPVAVARLSGVFGGHSASTGPSILASGCSYNDTPGPRITSCNSTAARSHQRALSARASCRSRQCPSRPREFPGRRRPPIRTAGPRSARRRRPLPRPGSTPGRRSRSLPCGSPAS